MKAIGTVRVLGALLAVWASMLAATCSWLKQSPTVVWYRLSTSATALHAIMTLPTSHVKEFLDSYELFDKERYTGDGDAKLIVNYYKVINHLCALGQVEKMYIPPVMDQNLGIFDNQVMWEEKGMADKLSIGPGKRVLDVGCGRGRIAHHVASYTGAKVTGLNIDTTQLHMAREFAQTSGLLGDRLEFVQGNYNDPLPFEDSSFDALYHVQALTYALDLEALLREMHRVLKPGAKISFLDWFQLPAYNASDPHHQHLLRETKAVLGAQWTPKPEDYHAVLEKVGFKLEFSGEASQDLSPDGGNQYPLIMHAYHFYHGSKAVVDFLVNWGIIPVHVQTLLERLSAGGQSFVDADRMRLFTTSWQIIATKV